MFGPAPHAASVEAISSGTRLAARFAILMTILLAVRLA